MISSNQRGMYESLQGFFAQLQASGVEHVAISPGSRSTPLTVAADRTDGLEVSIHLDERSGGFFALGLAKANKKPVALICTSGTAAANYLPAVIEAFHSGIPLIVLTADRPPELQSRGAPQTIDQVNLYGTHVRWFHQAQVAGTDSVSNSLALAYSAVEISTGQNPGPVHINWPLREPLEPPEVFPSLTSPLKHQKVESEISSFELPDIERGLLVAGPMDLRSEDVTSIANLSKSLGWPLIADPASGLRRGPHIENSHVIATGDFLFGSSWADKQVPDLVVQLGGLPTSKPYRLWLERNLPEKVFSIDHVGRHPDPVGAVTHRIDAHPGEWARIVSRTPRFSDEWVKSWETGDLIARNTLNKPATDPIFSDCSIVEALSQQLPTNASLVVGNSMAIRDLDAFLPVDSKPLNIYANRGANGIDGQVSTAVGVAHATNSPTVLFLGDLTLLHDLSGLLTARRLGLNLTVVVADNNGGGIFSFLPISVTPEIDYDRLFHTPHDLNIPDLAPLLGANLHQVKNKGDLLSALNASVGHTGIHLIHALVDAEINVKTHQSFTHAVHESLLL
ncbi:MAG TPA: 2-succinyl-5-enolpyruvyl-6-hydroxy-3-cyclohexene-1-carboxylic-acid synthase [Acidimicrobiales bacterium]|nr:2-succinyl-5-enolpyruvyl-6-hydroxy-3-cyclohexene-1-carboxylic-acid synthase [Acidimicrobiales bacterium]